MGNEVQFSMFGDFPGFSFYLKTNDERSLEILINNYQTSKNPT